MAGYQGTKPNLRIGGNTQDIALYDASLKSTAKISAFNSALSNDYPTTLSIGPSFFEAYGNFPDTKFVHGFNFGQAGNNSFGWENLLEVAPVACKALGNKMLSWEYGNEPDMFAKYMTYRDPDTWNEQVLATQWLNGTKALSAALKAACPDLKHNYWAPSFASIDRLLSPLKAWTSGENTSTEVSHFSQHNYVGVSDALGNTLQGTLMNHTYTAASLHTHTVLKHNLSLTSSSLPPYIIGECNSLAKQGVPGLSNTFGSALWNLDFGLLSAATNVTATYLHQGLDYRYAAWQPVQTNKTAIGTKPPFYGNIAVAAFLGDLTAGSVRVASIPLDSSYEAAYAHYTNNTLTKIAVINMRQYNGTLNGTLNGAPNLVARPTKKYSFEVPGNWGGVGIQRLLANGSDAISGISFDGVSFNYELDKGRPVRLKNVTRGERAWVRGGTVDVKVPDSSAVILDFD